MLNREACLRISMIYQSLQNSKSEVTKRKLMITVPIAKIRTMEKVLHRRTGRDADIDADIEMDLNRWDI